MRVAVIDAKDRPYEMAKVVEMNSGLYASYFSWLKVVSALMILRTLYFLAVLSYEVREEMGMNLPYQVLL